LRGLRVLVVEDEFVVAEELSAILADLGCKVVGPAASAGVALKLVQSEPLDGAILDLHLGEHWSTVLFPALNAKRIPIIVVTAYGSRGLPGWLDPHVLRLAKPVAGEILASAMEAAFTGRKRSHRVRRSPP
jgi:CheY-like chemotaxis protein